MINALVKWWREFRVREKRCAERFIQERVDEERDAAVDDLQVKTMQLVGGEAAYERHLSSAHDRAVAQRGTATGELEVFDVLRKAAPR